VTAVTIPRRRNYTAGQGGWFNPPPQRIPRREAESEIREYAFLDVTVQKMTREETRCVRGAGIEIGALGESWGDDRCSGLGISYISRRREASSSMLASFFLPLAPLLIGLLLFAFSGSVCCAHRRGRMKKMERACARKEHVLAVAVVKSMGRKKRALARHRTITPSRGGDTETPPADRQECLAKKNVDKMEYHKKSVRIFSLPAAVSAEAVSHPV